MNPELSIIVPVLNEVEQLPCLLTDLIRQQEVDFELLICDGGSTDGSQAVIEERLGMLAYPVRQIDGQKGRGRQLNAGAKAAKGHWLLFLHVDSRFQDPLALRKSIDQLSQEKSDTVAGRFALKFRRQHNDPSAGYYYYEWKARLERPECIHGDQGFLLHREAFQRVGRFKESLPVMEDTDFAERLRCLGTWQLLPAEISSSARRFEQEGLWQRQLVNSVIMCFRSIGWDEYFDAAREIYRQQPEAEKLRVRPFFKQVAKLMGKKTLGYQWRLWYRSGGYIRKHAWQLVFALDARRCFRAGLEPGAGKPILTRIFDPVYNLLTDNPLGRFAATLLLITWYLVTINWLLFHEGFGSGRKSTASATEK